MHFFSVHPHRATIVALDIKLRFRFEAQRRFEAGGEIINGHAFFGRYMVEHHFKRVPLGLGNRLAF
jgi:hypothetical protein